MALVGAISVVSRSLMVTSKEGAMRFAVTLVAACAVCTTVLVTAHHSHGNYEETFHDIEGVVTELHLLVPHSWIYLEVKNAGGVAQVWALEATSRPGLEKVGIMRD